MRTWDTYAVDYVALIQLRRAVRRARRRGRLGADQVHLVVVVLLLVDIEYVVSVVDAKSARDEYKFRRGEAKLMSEL